MKITTKRKADKILLESLFKPINGRTLRRDRYDRGKYKTGTSFVGREVADNNHIYAVWSENRKDSEGAYKALYCLTDY